jgi:hypothetical protein
MVNLGFKNMLNLILKNYTHIISKTIWSTGLLGVLFDFFVRGCTTQTTADSQRSGQIHHIRLSTLSSQRTLSSSKCRYQNCHLKRRDGFYFVPGEFFGDIEILCYLATNGHIFNARP